MKLKLDIDPDIVAMMAAEVAAGERAVTAAMREAGLNNVVVVVGGIVPNCEVPTLTDAGVGAVFHPGSSREDIVATISNLILEHRGI